MTTTITLEDIDRRLAALEKIVASQTTEKSNGEHTEAPSGRFAHLGGIQRRGPTTHEKRETPVDFSHIGGKKVGAKSKEDGNA